MGGHFRPNRSVYTALFLMLVGVFSRDGDSPCSSKQQSYIDIGLGLVIMDNVYVDLPAVVRVVGETTYEDTLDPGLISLVRHCLCLPEALGFYVPRRRRSSCAVVVALLLLVGGVQPNPGPTAHSNNNRSINLGCFNVRSAVNKSAEIHSIIDDTTSTYLP